MKSGNGEAKPTTERGAPFHPARGTSRTLLGRSSPPCGRPVPSRTLSRQGVVPGVGSVPVAATARIAASAVVRRRAVTRYLITTKRQRRAASFSPTCSPPLIPSTCGDSRRITEDDSAINSGVCRPPLMPLAQVCSIRKRWAPTPALTFEAVVNT